LKFKKLKVDQRQNVLKRDHSKIVHLSANCLRVNSQKVAFVGFCYQTGGNEFQIVCSADNQVTHQVV